MSLRKKDKFGSWTAVFDDDIVISYPDRKAQLLTHGSNATPDGWNAGEIPKPRH